MSEAEKIAKATMLDFKALLGMIAAADSLLDIQRAISEFDWLVDQLGKDDD